jgi:hypothetical protein
VAVGTPGEAATGGDKELSTDPERRDLVDQATLYLCKQGSKWIVVMDSPSVCGAFRLRYAGRDSFDARFELLSTARRARPSASIVTADGAVEGEDYEWRLDVRALETEEGALGVALQRELTAKPAHHVRRLARRRAARTCQRGRFRIVRSRPFWF